MNKEDEQPNNVTIHSCRSCIVDCGDSHDRNTSSIRVLLAQRSLCGGQRDGQLALLWESSCSLVSERLSRSEHSVKMKCGTGIECVAVVEWSRRDRIRISCTNVREIVRAVQVEM